MILPKSSFRRQALETAMPHMQEQSSLSLVNILLAGAP